MEDDLSQQGGEQLNKLLGANTVQFHTAYTLADLEGGKVGLCALPYPGAITSKGGTPNQKAERFANQIAYYHWIAPDAGSARQAVLDATAFFQDQVESTGHQCVLCADEGLTSSHGPIWWRALTSLRITTFTLAGRGADYEALANSVLGWIQGHAALCALGEIPSGVNAGKVLVPGARWKNPNSTNPWFAEQVPVPEGKDYPNDSLTDQVTNVIYQLIKTGSTPWSLPEDYFTLAQDRADVAGAALANQILEGAIGFGDPAGGPPGLHSELVCERYSNGHRAYFPQCMPCALSPALEAWADYGTGTLCLSGVVGAHPPPSFSGDPQTITIPPASDGDSRTSNEGKSKEER